MRRNFIELSILTLSLMSLLPAQAQPTIISPPPASGLSPSTAIVFKFSEAMDPDPLLTFASFLNINNPLSPLPTVSVWSAGNTVLTCTPSPAFPASTMIIWSVEGQNPAGGPLGGTPGGLFTTGTGSGGGGSGSGTNAITTFSVGKLHSYSQTSTALPTLDPDPYSFLAITGLASNRTATSVALTLPTAAVSNLVQLPGHPESFIVFGFTNNLATFDSTFPAGNYSFFVQAVSSNQTVVVNLPPGMAQPNAPHLTNYPAAQAVDPTQAFVLGWDPFSGGTAADYISVEIGTAYSSTNIGSFGALTGTATTFMIPASKLQPNTNYDSSVSFYRYVATTNGTNYATTAFRSTSTTFSLITTSGATGGPLVLTNASWSSGVFSFDVVCALGQIVTVEYTTDVLSAGAWPKLLTTTNSSGTPVHIVSPQAGSAPSLFYRARNGP
jgi:hypothetical protein